MLNLKKILQLATASCVLAVLAGGALLWLATWMSPPCASATSLQKGRPSPVECVCPGELDEVPVKLLDRLGERLSEQRYNSLSAALLLRGYCEEILQSLPAAAAEAPAGAAAPAPGAEFSRLFNITYL